MNRRPLLLVVILVAGAIMTWLVFAPRSPKHDGLLPPPGADKLPRAANPPRALEPLPLPDAATVPEMRPNKPAPPNMPAVPYTPEQRGETVHAEAGQDLEQVQGMLRDFRTAFGENPVGTNAEIMSALNGGNARQARLGPPDGAGLNEKGELVDRWGTPYFFHQIDARQMEVHSAGADKKLGTADDVVRR